MCKAMLLFYHVMVVPLEDFKLLGCLAIHTSFQTAGVKVHS